MGKKPINFVKSQNFPQNEIDEKWMEVIDITKTTKWPKLGMVLFQLYEI